MGRDMIVKYTAFDLVREMIVLESEPEVTRHSPNAISCSDIHELIGPTIVREEFKVSAHG